MSRIQSVRDNWTEIIERLRSDKQELANFLRFSAKMYKQGFPDAALIYQQNPNATKVAELETWNKLGRLVNKGEHSIAVFGAEDKCRYLFDVTQTNGKRLPAMWSMTTDLSADVTAVINEKYGKQCKTIQETIATMSVDSLQKQLPEMQTVMEKMKLSQEQIKQYQQSLVSAVRFTVSNRCEMDGGMKLSGNINLNVADSFKENRDLIRFCDLVQKSAKDTLLEIEREIVQILKQRREKANELQTQPDRATQSRNPVHRQSGRTAPSSKADRQMGQNVAGVDENRVSNGGGNSRNGGAVADNSEVDRRESGEPVQGAGQAVPTGESPSADVQRNSGVGEAPTSDNRTQGNGGSRFPSERITVDSLIERYNQADFNRRWDSYEIAGWILSSAKATEFRLDAIAHFNKFDADKYSAVQAEEIRHLIKTALENRDIQTIPEENEPVILHNEVVETSELPPLLDEKLIEGIIGNDRFFKLKKEAVAKFFSENEDYDKRAEFMKSVFNADYTELDVGDARVGYKANENGLTVWEGRFLSRTKESGFSWALVSEFTASMLERGVYIDKQIQPELSAAETKIKDFSEKDGQYYAEFLHNEEFVTAPVIRDSEEKAHIDYDGISYELNKQQLEDLNNFEFFRAPITHDINGFFADDLQEDDLILLNGERWRVGAAKDYSIRLENDVDNKKHFFGNWQEQLTKAGFEYIGSVEQPEIDEPIFAEPVAEQPEVEPFSQGEQLSFFGEPEPLVNITAKQKKTQSSIPTASTPVEQDMIDYALKCGSNEPRTLERIVAQFQKGKSNTENAEFLRMEFGEDGRGYNFVSDDKTHSALVAAWFDKDGISLNTGNAARDNADTHLSWEQVSERIGEMLDNGEFCSQDIIDRAAGYEMQQTAEKLWYLHQDCKVDYFIPTEMFKGGFPDSTARITASLADKDTVQKYIDGLSDLCRQYEENRDILRFHFHKPRELLGKLKDLLLERKEYAAKAEFSFKPKYFITEDEKDKLLNGGSNVQDGKFRTAEFFKAGHTLPEKVAFLKKEYGDGGSGRTGFNTWHDSKGLKYQKGTSISNPDCEVFMKWNEVANRIDKLIAEDRYISQNDVDERIRHAKYVLKNYSEDNPVDKFHVEQAKKVIAEYGEAEPQKSPVESIIEKAQAAGIPVEIEDLQTETKEAAVFMDTRDESFISVMQTEDGIDYTAYAPDLTPIDGGVWEMDEEVDLKFAAAELLATSESVLAEIPDYDLFTELADMNTDLDVPSDLARLKADVLADIPSEAPVIQKSDEPVVNAPEKIPTAKNEPKSGIPITYSFKPNDLVQGGAKTKFNTNIEAIQTLQKIENENRYATADEQAVMAKYVGWGGIPQAFTTDRAAESIGNLGEAAPTGWENEQKTLREILSEDEYKAARASTLTSFYTPPEVTDGVYQALSQFGFDGGNVLEPSMGVGNFFAKMPSEIKDNSKLYGVELDSISGRIAQQLYPESKIQIKGFEQTSFNNNSFDVVIGNIPFGDYRVSDKAYDKYKFKIHDYFAAKTVDKVKPGGVVALVTSKFTMDKQSEKARRYLAERCDLLGAIRLPNDAFKKNAGTEVTTDILFLKKRETMTVEVPDWVHMSETADGIPCNKYFVDNPDMVLGTMAWDERMKGKFGDDSRVTTCIADDSVPLAEQIKTAVTKIEGSIETVKAKEQENEQEYISADPSVRNYTHTIVDGNLYFRENEVMVKVAETGNILDRMMGMHKIRQAAMAVIDAQAENCSDEELSKLQRELNYVYDKFKKAYGNITDSANERCFRQDDDYNTLAALEIVDTEKKTVEKAEIFSKRTIQPELEIISVDTPQEALQVSIDRLGAVNIPYMAQLAGCEPDKIVKDLGDDVFRNPAKVRDDEPFSGYEDASEYLSGNVREKLRIAKDYAKHIDSSFERNVTALEKVIPKDLEAGEISVRIGANWIDVEDYNRFLKEYAKADMGRWGHPVTRTKMGEYKIEGKYQDKSVAANETFGTSRMSSYHIFENLLNQRDVIIRDRKEDDGKVYYEINAKETQLAKEKARQMKDGFKEWIWNDIDRREKYVGRYNDLFNAIRGREYDGSHQSFPGMNPSIKLKPHQENAVLRGKLGGNTLLAHAVGAGKSFEMVATAMEKKRLGLISKGCIVVPKHLTLQMASEWIRLYPNAKLLVARPEDFEKSNRQKFIARCVTGEYDAVIMSFTQFERIPMSDEYRKQFMERELNEIMNALEEVDSTDRVSVKSLERQKMKLEERLEKLTSSKKDNSLCFEKLGFDYLVCDEAHNYKNCFVATKMSNVAGVQTTAAQKSEDMLMKTQYLNNKYGCNNILYATGTPIPTPYKRFIFNFTPM